MKRNRCGFFVTAIATLVCVGCGSVGYRLDGRIAAPVPVPEIDCGGFFVRSVQVECHSTGYEADFAKASVAGLTAERLNNFLAAEYPSCFSARGKYPVDLLVNVSYGQKSHDFITLCSWLTLTLLPLPVDINNSLSVECVAPQKTQRVVLFACEGEVILEKRGWTSGWPTGMLPCPFETDTQKKIVVDQESVLYFSEESQQLLAEQVVRRLVASITKTGVENVKP